MLGMLNPPKCVDTTGAGHSPLSQFGQCPELFVDGSSALTAAMGARRA